MKRALAVATFCALCACGSDGQAQSSPSSSPQPLGSCQTVEMRVGSADVVLTTNVDATLATVGINAPDEKSHGDAAAYVKQAYGDAKPDTHTVERPWKFGISRRFDMCGHLIEPTTPPSPTATPSPS